MVKIYTKSGDLGTTSLLGSRVDKTDLRVVAYGNLDELNAYLGEILLYIQDIKDKDLIKEIIKEIFSISSHISCVSEEFSKHLPQLKEFLLREIESRIDEIDSKLPKLKNFILPIGTIEIVKIHQVRTITRRCERSLVYLRDEINPYIIQLLNRLSDYFFILARKQCYDTNQEEFEWKNN